MLDVNLKVLLEDLAHEERLGPKALFDGVRQAIDTKKAEEQFVGSVQKYVRSRGLGTLYGKAFYKGKVRNYDALAQLLRQLRITPDMLLQFRKVHAPWDELPRGTTVVFVIGGKHSPSPHAAEGESLVSRVVGARDAEALNLVHGILRDECNIDFEMRILALDPGDHVKAQKQLARLQKSDEVGAVIVLGSEIVNPMAAPIARRMFPKLSKASVEFRWKQLAEDGSYYLSLNRECAEEGIALNRKETRPSLLRDHDAVVLEWMAKKRRPRRYFRDAGVLGMRAVEGTLLVLCSGHGGCGTLAAVHALAEVEYIEGRYQASAASSLPAMTVLEPIEVLRKQKPNAKKLDLLDFDRTYGKGWRFFHDADAPELEGSDATPA